MKENKICQILRTIYENRGPTIGSDSNLFKTMENNVDNKVNMIL